MDLSAFRSRRALDAMAVASVGTALAAATGAVFRLVFGGGTALVLITALPTLLFGTAWAVLLRWGATLSKSKVRVGWVLSVPLAALNGALACGLMFVVDERGGAAILRFLTGMLLGATVGAMCWIPGLVLTLLVFGLPIARAQRLAAQGLAGQERGDGFVGAASAAIATVALASSFLPAGRAGHSWPLPALASVAAALGLATLGASLWRERLRRAFVAEVEAGRVEQFRVDATDAGKVLVRVVSQGEGYRVADYAEEVAALDAGGSVTRAHRGDT